jgi:hypothetical protein
LDGSKVAKGIQTICDTAILKGGQIRFNEQYQPSAFLALWSTRALIGYRNSPTGDPDLKKKCNDALDRMVIWSHHEVHRQVVMHDAGSLDAFDPIQLAYALVILCDTALKNTPKPNRRIVRYALKCIFRSQLENGLWPRGLPIFHYAARGNVYTFSFEMLDVLLVLAHRYFQDFAPHVENVENSMAWADENEMVEQVDGRDLRGWKSNWLVTHKRPEAWSTAAVLNVGAKIESLLSTLIRESVLQEFKATRFPIPNRSEFDSILDSDVRVDNKICSLNKILHDELIEPNISNSSKARPQMQRRWKATILFGPPGTAKTTFARAIARALGWPLVRLTTSHIMEKGLELAVNRAKYIFEKLSEAAEIVVLFDEMEEFVLERQKGGERRPEVISRMITTSMLTLIDDMRTRGRIIFIGTTNHLEDFDNAITRPGRFDLILRVAPPNRQSKQEFLLDYLADKSPNCVTPGSEDVVNKFLESTYDKCLQYYTYKEWVHFAEILVTECQDGALEEKALKSAMALTKDQITISQKVRKDYKNSEERNRIQ